MSRAVPADTTDAPVSLPEATMSRRARRAALAAASVSSSEMPALAASVDQTSINDSGSSGDRPSAADESQPTTIDEFEAAARLFSFTGENAVIAPAATVTTEGWSETTPISPVPTALVDSRRGKGVGHSFKRMTAASFSVGVMGIVGLLAVGMTTPAQAVGASAGSLDTTSATLTQPAGDVPATTQEIQAYVAPSQTQNVTVDRSENYQTGTLVEMAGVAGISQTSNSVFTADPNCPIQWPFAVGVPMSYGFGMRSGTLHEGIDFTPGEGAHIQAIADGVVRISTDDGGAYGVTIVIDHVIDGQMVSSRYAHMIYGSRQVQVGDKVSVGEFIGETGDTGRSFGAHTHFEIEPGGGTAIDPLPWLQEHATC